MKRWSEQDREDAWMAYARSQFQPAEEVSLHDLAAVALAFTAGFHSGWAAALIAPDEDDWTPALKTFEHSAGSGAVCFSCARPAKPYGLTVASAEHLSITLCEDCIQAAARDLRHHKRTSAKQPAASPVGAV